MIDIVEMGYFNGTYEDIEDITEDCDCAYTRARLDRLKANLIFKVEELNLSIKLLLKKGKENDN